MLTIEAGDAWEEGVEFYDRGGLYLSEEIPAEFIQVGDVQRDGIRRRGGPEKGGRGRGRNGERGEGRDRDRGRGGRGRGRRDDRHDRNDRFERTERYDRDEREVMETEMADVEIQPRRASKPAAKSAAKSAPKERPENPGGGFGAGLS
ncbi:MAG: hypothetical protein R3E96_05695 [Planctomycetota bacterium]